MRRLTAIAGFIFMISTWPGPAWAKNPLAPASDRQLLLERIRGALENDDLEELSRLSYWAGIPDDARQEQIARREKLSLGELTSVRLQPLPDFYRVERVRGLFVHRVNLTPVGLVRIAFLDSDGYEQVKLLPYGEHDGGFYLVGWITEILEQRIEKDRQLAISVTVPSEPDVRYTVNCSYERAGQDLNKKVEASRNSSTVVWGRKINWCRIKNRSESSWVRLVLKAQGDAFFESGEIAPGEMFVYP